MMPLDPDKAYLIVNADDFGLSPGVNTGIIAAHEHGIVTSTSLMVRWPAAQTAAAYAREHPSLDLGLHIDLSEWICREGNWEPLYEVVSLDDAAAVSAEISRQVNTFHQLVGKPPSHIDSHQHAHRNEPVRSIVTAIARELAVPLRHFAPDIQYLGRFYGQNDKGDSYPELIGVGALLEILHQIPRGRITELGCHPGTTADITSMYLHEREREVKTLCDPWIKKAIADLDVRLSSFAIIRSLA